MSLAHHISCRDVRPEALKRCMSQLAGLRKLQVRDAHYRDGLHPTRSRFSALTPRRAHNARLEAFERRPWLLDVDELSVEPAQEFVRGPFAGADIARVAQGSRRIMETNQKR